MYGSTYQARLSAQGINSISADLNGVTINWVPLEGCTGTTLTYTNNEGKEKIIKVDEGQTSTVIPDAVLMPSGIGENVDRYYDKTGEISMEQGKLLFSLSEGLCSVLDEKTQKYGYVDKTGKMVISPVFDEAERFQDGYAVVKVQDQYGIVKNPLLQK